MVVYIVCRERICLDTDFAATKATRHEVRRQESEDRIQKTGVRSQKSEVRSQKSGVRRQK